VVPYLFQLAALLLLCMRLVVVVLCHLVVVVFAAASFAFSSLCSLAFERRRSFVCKLEHAILKLLFLGLLNHVLQRLDMHPDSVNSLCAARGAVSRSSTRPASIVREQVAWDLVVDE